ncbi:MAG: hypothetical protein H0U23_01920, partial [Blastocatellia bacterium]|nr:hypothetical protein [Blastocatellia bacterium]
YIADTGNHTIRKITPSGVVSTLAGSPGLSGSADGTGSAARFTSPIGVVLDGLGNLYIGDSDNNLIRKITPAGVVTTVAGLAGVAGSADGTGSAARFSGPRGMAFASGNIYVADTFNNTIRKVTPAGVVTTLAGLAGQSGSSDGTGSAARFNRPRGLVADIAGNLYVADTANNTIRVVTTAGVVTTLAGAAGVSGSTDGIGLAARFFGPIGITVDDAGNLYVADTVNNTIRKIAPGAVVTTLAGLPLTAGSADGAGSQARFVSPQGLAVDSTMHLFISDTGNNTIRISGSVSRPLNISTRARVETGQNVMIGGFIITGEGMKTVVLRAIGPSLEQAGLTGVLTDPVLELRALDGSLIRSDDNWQDDPAQAALITATGLAPQNDLESAIIVTLDPGSYTAIVNGKDDGTGIGLVEVYDLGQETLSHLANISTRGSVGTADNVMIGGFILGGGTSGAQVLVRAIGPSLGAAGVNGVLSDPTLELRDADGTLISSNDNWQDSEQTEIEDTGLAPTDPLESAILAELPAGSYTAIVAGAGGVTGVGLVEVYALQ